ncbi:hypothetical protein P2G88_11630 [Aliiglaciecola sp. CAU 1673]|uniref:flagellar basal body-associated FliL family protein n=1 Tax=Aliiglaciecola sp. CAU 1673 TaxID=3032595 RepID=UPI0023DAA2DB|nr:flagellar basal body-associated FliL family protein [Aliiglaciecola sp. CAU 1673]MDF2178900.1 hypothetical protein [Aliiglaciecola sp. CAU 1673]
MQLQSQVLGLTLLIFSYSGWAAQVQQLPSISVNPANDAQHRLTASVSLVWQQEYLDLQDGLEAQERVVATLKTFRVKDLIKDNAVDQVKAALLQQLRGLGQKNKVKDLYVTELLVEFSGQPQTYLVIDEKTRQKMLSEDR